jgi:epoxyqueuosine reductase
VSLTKEQVIEKSKELGFADIGFTSADPFVSQDEILASRHESYQWTHQLGLPLCEGTDPKKIMKDAQSIIVVVQLYYSQAFPSGMVGYFGRAYLDDDRVTRDGFTGLLIRFLKYLRENGIQSEIPFHMPHRLAGARAGLGTFGKNNFFYSNKLAGKSSWVNPVPIIVDRAFAPDSPTVEVDCPSWCKNACIAACPTGALSKPNKIDPRKCISYLTYYGTDLPDLLLREQMGTWIYGCDRCQDVCPRNQPWLTHNLPINQRIESKKESFELAKLLHMDEHYYNNYIKPHMFYTASTDLWRWHMNVARAMGNSLDRGYIPDLVRAFKENPDERVKAMCAWALGRLDSERARTHLRGFLEQSKGRVLLEVKQALGISE